MKKFLLYLLVALSLISCSRENQDNADLEVVDLTSGVELGKLSEFFDYIEKVTIVPLETNNECFIRGVKLPIVSEDRIIIFDEYNMHHQVAVFDQKGRWIASSVQGNGPGEISKAYGVAYDHEQSRIVVQQNRKVTVYDADLKYIDEYESPLFVNMAAVNGKYYLKALNHQTNKQLAEDFRNREILVTDNQMRPLNAFRPVENDLGILEARNFYITNSEILLTESFCDTIFSVTENAVTPKYLVKYKTDKEQLTADEELTARDLNSYIQKTGYVFRPDFAATESHQFIKLLNLKEGKMLVSYRDNKTHKVVKCVVSLEDYNEQSRLFAQPLYSNNNCFVSVLDSELISTVLNGLKNVVSSADFELLQNRSEDDNPVLILYTLKSFE